MKTQHILHQLKWTLQALALPADVQLSLFPDFVSKADELALDFDHWKCLAIEYKAVTPEQMNPLLCIDQYIDTLEEARHWTLEAIAQDEAWQHIRALAKIALDACGWKVEIPPKDRSLYIRPTETEEPPCCEKRIVNS